MNVLNMVLYVVKIFVREILCELGKKFNQLKIVIDYNVGHLIG